MERKERYITVTGTGDLATSVIDSLAKVGVRLSEIESRRGNLDDAFVMLTKENPAETSGAVRA